MRATHEPREDPRSPPRPLGPLAALCLHGLAAGSGFAALVYEVVWTRRLTFVFGATIRAVSAVLAAYMGGLALGALAASRRASATRAPIRAFGVLEACVAFAGLAVPFAIAGLRAVDSTLYDGGAAHGGLTAARLLLAFVVVGAPAGLMGASFPLLVRAVGGEDSARVATIYAANTAGAVAGTFFAGFYALGALGVTRTERVAVAVNLLVAGLAVALARVTQGGPNAPASSAQDTDRASEEADTPADTANLRAPRASSSSESPGESPGEQSVESTTGPASESSGEPLSESPGIPTRWLLASAVVTGAACVACEVLWSRALAFSLSWLNNTTYTFPAMLGLVLLGVAGGSALVAPWLARTRRPAVLYAWLVTLAGLAVARSAWTMSTRGTAPFGDPLGPGAQLVARRALANVLAETGAVVLPTALLLGAAFPALIRAARTARGERVGFSARAYSASTVGSIAGSLAAAFVIAPRAGIVRGVLLVGAALSLTGLGLLARASGRPRGSERLAWLGVIACLLGLTTRMSSRPLLSADGAPTVHYEEGPTATVAVARAADGYLRLDVDGVPVAGTSPTMLTDQKSLAHIPMMLLEAPSSALTVGFGSGGTSHSLLLHPGLARVRAVEIAPEILRAAPSLTASNHGVLSRSDPRYQVILDDARSYLAHTRATYDLIATDCTDLRYRSNANLYDLEYFRFCRGRLNPGGVVAVWLPLGGLSREMFKVALRTFGEVFPDFVVFWPNGQPSHYVVLLGWRDRRVIRWDRMTEVLARAPVRDDLREISLDDPVKILSTLVADGGSLRAALSDAPVNTEDAPVLEFVSPLTGYAPRVIEDNLEFLLAHRAPIETLVRDVIPPAQSERLGRMAAAVGTVITAHGASFRGETLGAARGYLDALAQAPDDLAVRDRSRELVRDLSLARGEGDPWGALLRCRFEQLAGDAEAASRCYDSLARVSDDEVRGSALRWRFSRSNAR
jgi:spermidine synthase